MTKCERVIISVDAITGKKTFSFIFSEACFIKKEIKKKKQSNVFCAWFLVKSRKVPRERVSVLTLLDFYSSRFKRAASLVPQSLKSSRVI